MQVRRDRGKTLVCLVDVSTMLRKHIALWLYDAPVRGLKVINLSRSVLFMASLIKVFYLEQANFGYL